MFTKKESGIRGLAIALYFVISAAFIASVFMCQDASLRLLLSCIFAISELVLFILLNGRYIDGMVSFSNIFVICLFLFHFGQLVLIMLFPNDIYNLSIKMRYFTTEELSESIPAIFSSFSFIAMGMLFPKKQTELDNDLSTAYIDSDSEQSLEKSILSKAKVFIIFLFPFKFLIDIIFVLKSFSTTYLERIEWYGSFPDFFITIINMSLIGFALLLIAYKNDPRKQNRAFIFIIIYLLIIMLSGRRSENVAYVAILSLIYLQNRKEKIPALKWVMYGGLIFLFAAFLYTIVYLRNYSVTGIRGVYEAFITTLFRHNVFFEALREYGNTGYTAVCVIEKWLKVRGPSLGTSYILGLASILPNITGMPGKLADLSNYGKQMQYAGTLDSRYVNIGGSIIGETFYNFGIVGGLVFSLLLGLVIGKICRTITKYSNRSEYDKYMYYIPVMFSVLYWTRSYFCGLTREITWAIVVCYIINHCKFRVGKVEI